MSEASKARGGTTVVSAFAANPMMTSETGIGWLFLKQTALHAARNNVQVFAFMNERSRRAVRPELERLNLDSSVVLVELSMPRWSKWLESQPTLTRLEYLVWCGVARRMLRRLDREREVLLAHHVTFATEMLPTPISALRETTLRVWGPVGAAGDRRVYDIQPVTALSRREKRLHRIRDTLSAPIARLFARRVDVVVAQNDEIRKRFEAIGKDVIVFPNVVLKNEANHLATIGNSTDVSFIDEYFDAYPGSRFLLCVGHLIARKRFEIGIEALRSARLNDVRLVVLGTELPGNEPYLRDFAERRGVASRVDFLGKRPRQDVLRAMERSGALFHPSAREGASGVVGEATATGLPVVCFDRTGASSVLKTAGTSGVVLDASSCTLDDIVGAIETAFSLPRLVTDKWSEQRLGEFAIELYAHALQLRGRNAREFP